MKTNLIALGILVCMMSCQHSNTQDKPSEKKEIMQPGQVAVKGLSAAFNEYDEADVRKYFAQDYIQHNPFVPTGIEPIIGFLPALKAANTTLKVHRVIEDGDFAVMHCTYDNAEAFGAKEIVTFDIFRVADGKLMEHWDGVNPIVKETASGRSQYDGATQLLDLDKTEANKTLVRNFVEDILLGKNPGKITDYVSTKMYHQHNIAVKDGLEGLGAAIEYLNSKNDMFKYTKVHQVIGEGNFVFVRSEGEWHGKTQVFNDLFRVADGKLVEHWDVVQEVPEKMAHANGMF